MDVASIINRANQLNPNNWRYWKSRSYLGRPENWAALIGPTRLPAVEWLYGLSNLTSLAKDCIIITRTCIHGIAKTFCYLCTLKGAVLFVTATSIALVYWYYPKELKDYACKGWNATGSLCRSTAHFVSANAVVVAQYSNKFNKEHIWHYGVVLPFRAIKGGVIYTGEGLKKMAIQIGYYCGPKTPEDPQKYDD